MDRGAWFARLIAADGAVSRVLSVESGSYPDGTTEVFREGAVDNETFIGWRAQASLHDSRGVHVALAPDLTAKAPALWFAEFHEDTSTPTSADHLIAFTGHNQPVGALLDQAAVASAGISYSTQLAAIRWFPATGEIDQLYVGPAWRRQGIGRVLVYAIGVLSIARGGPRVWSKGPRTELGEQFRNASSLWVRRTPEVTEFAPPMTPGEASSLSS